MIVTSPGRVNVGGVVLNWTDANDATWVFDTIEGWHSGPGIEVTQSQRGSGHGQFAQRGRRTGRQIIVSGHVFADTRAPVEKASRRLAALLADGDFGVFAFDDDDGPALWTNVQLLEQPRIAWSGREFFAYQLTLLSPDAYRYGNVSTASTAFASDPVGAGLVFDLFGPDGVLDFGAIPTSDGTALVSNPGSASAAPVFTIAGPAPVGGFSIADTVSGARVTYVGEIPAGSTLVIDARDGSALLDGTADRSGQLVVSQWPWVAPESEATFRFAPESVSSAAVLTVTLTATYY